MKIAISKQTSARSQTAWLGGAVLLGFSVSAVFAGLLRLPRSVFLLPFSVITTVFLYSYFRWSGIDVPDHFRQKPVLGILGAVISGPLVVSNVLSQRASPAPRGWGLLFAILWPGIAYGTLDALLLSVMPVMAAWLMARKASLTITLPGRMLAFSFALAASLVVTAAYHLGYPEFRGPQVLGPIIGNGILTAAYLLSGSPLSTTLGHVAMHVASVLHGMETTVQLPPHY